MTIIPGAHVNLVGITHKYKSGQNDVLQNINLEFKPGEATALIGRSGCGKSTLLHIMSGMLSPSKGKVYIDGCLVESPSPKWIVMFQQALLYPWMTVRQNISLGLKFTGRMHQAKEKVPALLELVELSDLIDSNVQNLSGGQQQRVALARSLIVTPDVLFLDEPFSALDTFTRTALQRDVRRISKKLGITLVIVSHDITEAVIMADRIIVMQDSPGEVFADLKIPLSEAERSNPKTEFQSARREVQNTFEDAAGLEELAAREDTEIIEHQSKKMLSV